MKTVLPWVRVAAGIGGGGSDLMYWLMMTVMLS